VVAQALAAVQSKHSAWRRTDLGAAVAEALPDRLGVEADDEVQRLIDGLTDQALSGDHAREITAPELADLPLDLLLEDGRSAYQPPAGPRYATHGHLRAERALQDSAVRRGAPALSTADAAGYLGRLAAEGLELGADQRFAVVGILTSGAMTEKLVGPAGTGKSVVVGQLARAWQDPELWGSARRAFGLAAAQAATDVLTAEGLTARNISRWLATQERLAQGRPAADDVDWALTAGDLVAVDESAVVSTSDIARAAAYAERAGAKLLLVGDHRQLAAIGPWRGDRSHVRPCVRAGGRAPVRRAVGAVRLPPAARA
jgi:hypothetical protein